MGPGDLNPLRGQGGIRLVFTALGLSLMALGVAVVTLAGIGTAPVSAPVWVLTLNGGLSFGTWTFVVNVQFLLLQALLLLRRFPRAGWLQLPTALVFSVGIDGFMWLMNWMRPEAYVLQLGQVILGTFVLGLGVACLVAPQLLYLPGEGLVVAVASITAFRLGRLKIGFDVTMVALAVVLSMLLFEEVCGIREGTAIAALLTGSVVGWVMPTVRRVLYRLLGLDGPTS